jgi:hypothetical protein
MTWMPVPLAAFPVPVLIILVRILVEVAVIVFPDFIFVKASMGIVRNFGFALVVGELGYALTA